MLDPSTDLFGAYQSTCVETPKGMFIYIIGFYNQGRILGGPLGASAPRSLKGSAKKEEKGKETERKREEKEGKKGKERKR